MNIVKFIFRSLLLAATLLMLMVIISTTGALAKDVPLKTKEGLKAALGSPQLTIFDVRLAKDWSACDKKIKGARREDPDKVSTWAPQYTLDHEIVLYYTKGIKSSRVGRELMDLGFTRVSVLKGRWNEWFEAGYPVDDAATK